MDSARAAHHVLSFRGGKSVFFDQLHLHNGDLYVFRSDKPYPLGHLYPQGYK